MLDWAAIRTELETEDTQKMPAPLRVRTVILAAIQAGYLVPGTRLKETEMGAAFAVSRTPLREALAALKAEQILELDGDGLRVRKLDWRDITALYELRANLDGMAAFLAAQRASLVERQLINQICLEEAKLIDDGAEPVTLARQNRRFHHAIMQAAGNQFLAESLERLARLMVLTGATAYSLDDRVAPIRNEHVAINDAIQNNMPDIAKEKMQEHLANALTARLTLISLGGGVEVD